MDILERDLHKKDIKIEFSLESKTSLALISYSLDFVDRYLFIVIHKVSKKN